MGAISSSSVESQIYPLLGMTNQPANLPERLPEHAIRVKQSYSANPAVLPNHWYLWGFKRCKTKHSEQASSAKKSSDYLLLDVEGLTNGR